MGVLTEVRYMETSGSSERSGTLERSTSSAPAFPVSHTVTPGVGKGSLTPGICGPRHGMSFGWWDRNGSCLRTYQASFLEVTDGRATGSQFLESFPSWGLMLDGEFIAQPMPGHPTSENGGGCWPTPAASSGGTHTGISAETARNELARGNQIGLGAAAALWPTPVGDGDRTTNYQQGGTSLGFAARNPEMWPTPRAGKTTDEEEESWRARYEEGKVNTPPLGLAVQMWPTPDAYNDPKSGGSSPHQPSWADSKQQIHLHHAVKMWATPNTFDAVDAKSQEALDHEHESARPGRSNPGNLRDQIAVDEGTRFWNTPTTMDSLPPKSQESLDYEATFDNRQRTGPNQLRNQLAVEEGQRQWKWATPTGEDAKNTAGPGREKRHGPMLNLQVNKWPTPKSARSGPDYARQEREGSGGYDLVTAIGGSLNPDWVEQHLMSLPEGWTRLEPLRLGTNGRHIRRYGQHGFDVYPDKGAYQEWFDAMRDGTWWFTERGLPRVTTGAENRVNRLKMLGNGIVPATLALFLTDD